MTFDIAPRRFARYRSADGRYIDMRHYDDDNEQYTDACDVVWTRVVVTTQRYRAMTAAWAELNVLEAAKRGDVKEAA